MNCNKCKRTINFYEIIYKPKQTNETTNTCDNCIIPNLFLNYDFNSNEIKNKDLLLNLIKKATKV